MSYPRLDSLSIEDRTEEDDGPRYIHTDQTYIVFDVDQIWTASETISIKRLAKKGLVAYRFMTNAPTRYLVKPNSGVLEDSKPVKVKIALYGNRHNPQHILILQAVEIFSKEEGKTVWNSRTLERQCVQEIKFMLGTTLSDVDKVTRFTDTSKETQEYVANVLQLSNARGEKKKKELEDLLEMLKADNGRLLYNIEQTTRLRDIIKEQIKHRRDVTGNKLMKIVSLEKEQETLKVEIAKTEYEIQLICERFRIGRSPQAVSKK
uniref:Major sperm protein n=1 Tax=Haemonchus contortus TaxID=6289 RepID=A0A7I4XUV4_HAECO